MKSIKLASLAKNVTDNKNCFLCLKEIGNNELILPITVPIGIAQVIISIKNQPLCSIYKSLPDFLKAQNCYISNIIMKKQDDSEGVFTFSSRAYIYKYNNFNLENVIPLNPLDAICFNYIADIPLSGDNLEDAFLKAEDFFKDKNTMEKFIHEII